jgi:hypothetical protein
LEVLTTRLLELADEKMSKNYITRLNPYVCYELKLWKPQNIPKDRYEMKVVENKTKDQ